MNEKLSSLNNNSGFTLIEIIIAVTLVAILAITVVPRMTGVLSARGENFKIFTGLIAKTYDDSFLNDKINYLVVHLYDQGAESIDDESDIFKRVNGLSVVNYTEKGFTDNKRRILKFRKFPGTFRIDAVILSTGEPVRSGNVLIPFYPDGTSDNAIIHIYFDTTQQWSVRISKHLKEPEVSEGFITFSNDSI